MIGGGIANRLCSMAAGFVEGLVSGGVSVVLCFSRIILQFEEEIEFYRAQAIILED